MLLDNCTAHPHVEGLSSIKLVFLPPNTTSKLQPMDQGIINNLKQKYRRFLIEYLLKCFDKSLTPEINLRLDWIYRAWKCVTPTTIRNCFLKAGIMHTEVVTSVSDSSSSEDDDIPLSTLANE
ncbi:tigger transposable element-derived protein 6-like [Pecten maximus]|uniref:tigger transposable element-derived protein 6-like n=1 Tax=Pecten maximus TaxID=6579 RepID=UPI001458C6A1|nr:tigger transposable element-derived protein 6-like [Pecten maximus]